jgi:hypothetical protein
MVKFTKGKGSENVTVVACFYASGACIPFFVVWTSARLRQA